MGEFELIRRFFYPLAEASRLPSVVLGPGDDCAIQRVAADEELVFSVDTLVEGVHFPEHYPPERLARRSLAVASSDLAAMGAQPACFTLALTLPAANESWLKGFAAGLADACADFQLALAGGDTTRGPLALSLQVHGTVPAGTAICRSGAKSGDLICVSGTLGDAGAALALLSLESPTPNQARILNRYHAPEPRLALGQALRGVATAAIDVSDGLLADLQHLLEASAVGGVIRASDLPLSSALLAERADAVDLALNAGDDYELCVTLPDHALKSLPDSVRRQLTVIGEVVPNVGLSVDGATGSASHGYDHFGVRS